MSAAARPLSAVESPPEAIRVLVGGDVAFWRASLCSLLSSAGFDVVGDASGVDETLARVARTRPHVVVANFAPRSTTERQHNVEVARVFKERYPEVGLVVLASQVRAATAVELFGLDTGGIGYVLTDRVDDVDELSDVVRDTAVGRAVVDPGIISELLARTRRSGHPLLRLTAREREVLALMAQGRSNGGIARRLFLTEHTVEKHIGQIMRKLGIDNAPDDHRRVRAVLIYLEAT